MYLNVKERSPPHRRFKLSVPAFLEKVWWWLRIQPKHAACKLNLKSVLCVTDLENTHVWFLEYRI